LSPPAGQLLWPAGVSTLTGKAAALMHSLAGNHALVDGNKRLALLATVVFLRVNGYVLNLTDDEAFRSGHDHSRRPARRRRDLQADPTRASTP
jgi:death on curing protein